MHVVVRTPVSGYTPGQTINVSVEVGNKSATDAEFSVELRKVRIMMQQHTALFQFQNDDPIPMEIPFQVITFHIHPNSPERRTDKIWICAEYRIGYSPANSHKLHRTSLLIPPLPPTDAESNSICKVRYVLEVSDDEKRNSMLIYFTIWIARDLHS